MAESAEIVRKETPEAEKPLSLKQQTLRGLKWSTIAQVGKQVSQFVIVAILARLLSPDDFGLLGMITVFTGFAMTFSEMGLGPALVQKQDVTEEHLSSAFWVNIAMGALLTLGFIAAAPAIAWFYEKPELTPLISVISLHFLFMSFTLVQQALLQKEMDFKPLMVRDIAAVVGGGAVGITCALNGFGVWSLVYQALANSLINGVSLWFFSSWRPRFLISLSHLRSMFKFSANLTGFQIVNYFSRNLDYLLIGKFLGAEALGFYTLAYKLMLLPLQNITWVLNKVMFPALSKIQSDLARFRDAYLKLISAISGVTFPIMAALFLLADELVLLVYGPKWNSSIMLIKILCLSGALQSLSSTVGLIYNSQGRTDIGFKFALFLSAPSVALAVLLGMQFGITGVALFYAIRTALVAIPSHHIANSIINLSWADFLRPLSINITKTGVVFALAYLFSNLAGSFRLVGAFGTGMLEAAIFLVSFLLLFGWGLSPARWQSKLQDIT